MRKIARLRKYKRMIGYLDTLVFNELPAPNGKVVARTQAILDRNEVNFLKAVLAERVEAFEQ